VARHRFRSAGAVALVLVGLTGACSDGDDTVSSTTSVPPVSGPRFTPTGRRAGFAHGYELVRRESPRAVGADLDLMASTGARWFRAGIGWGHIERDRGTYDWASTDRVVRGALDRGLSVVAVVGSAPGWDAAPGCRTFECAPAEPGPYADFVALAARRYAPLGVHHWEIWNEPNHSAFWGPRPDAEAYTELLRAASTAIHAVEPSATVMSGGLSPARDVRGQIAPVTFLRRIYQLGARPYLDAVAHHPYQFPALPSAPDLTNALFQTKVLHDVMVDFDDGHKRIWGTEVGAPTRGDYSVSEGDQAQWVREYYRIWNDWSFTGPLLWYTARDHGNRDTIEDSFGLVHHDREAKPGLAAFVDVMREG
jgi:hypothetical protein